MQLEPSTDAHSWAKREERFKKKFDAGKKYIPALFRGLKIPKEIDQVAVFVFATKNPYPSLRKLDRFLVVAVSVACCSGESPQAESNIIRQIRQATGFMRNLHKI